MFKLATTATIAALAAAALAASSLGAAGTLTKAQVIERGSTICKAAEKRVESTPSPRSQNPFAASAPRGDRGRAITFLRVYADSLQSVRVGLGRLDAPPQGRALLRGFLADLGPTIATFRAAHTDALAGRYKAALAHAQSAFAQFDRASAKTKAYGFPKGVCQSG